MLAAAVVLLGAAPALGLAVGPRLDAIGAGTLPATWSNPLGAQLTRIADDVWLAERPFFPTLPGLGGVDVGGKMAVVRLPSGALWVHSPVALDAPLAAALAELGPVKHVVTPNTEHQKWAGAWLARYPDAVGFACPGLRERKPEVGWSATLGGARGLRAPPASWEGAVDFVHVEDRWPLGVRPGSFFDEVVFCHAPSRTLFCADLWWDYPSGAAAGGGDAPAPSTATRLWKFGMDFVYRPVYNRLMTTERSREAFARVLALEFDAIAPCHGEILATGGKAALARHLALAPPGSVQAA